MYRAYGRLGVSSRRLLLGLSGSVSLVALTAPDAVFQPVWTPPASDGSGFDRRLLRRANDLLMSAGCKRQGDRLLTPSGAPFVFEFLDSGAGLQP